MTEQIGFDVDAVDALAEALADVGGMGDEFRAEPQQVEFSPTRLKCALTAQTLLGITRRLGYELTKAAS